MIKFITGVLIGTVGVLFIWLIVDSLTFIPEKRQCMTQQIHLRSSPSSNDSYPYITVGESVICAKGWQISNIYGPDAETFYGRIKLRDWDSKEFTTK